MHKLNRAALLGLAVAALALGGCKTTEEACCGECQDGEAATLTSNETCPVTGKPVNPDAATVAFDGQEVGFCCGGCAGKFEAMSDAEKAAALTH